MINITVKCDCCGRYYIRREFIAGSEIPNFREMRVGSHCQHLCDECVWFVDGELCKVMTDYAERRKIGLED